MCSTHVVYQLYWLYQDVYARTKLRTIDCTDYSIVVLQSNIGALKYLTELRLPRNGDYELVNNIHNIYRTDNTARCIALMYMPNNCRCEFQSIESSTIVLAACLM